nr:hypothetical protein [Saprospiraceae bacterium]
NLVCFFVFEKKYTFGHIEKIEGVKLSNNGLSVYYSDEISNWIKNDLRKPLDVQRYIIAWFGL